MDEEAKVIDWITSEVETESCTMQDYPVYHWGKRVIDRSGDYLIVYFHPLLEKSSLYIQRRGGLLFYCSLIGVCFLMKKRLIP
ncbi:hypothetical protein [Pseudalkalibacillus sp. NRS-1564]|uniref:hypothetical protein n=1 Tax=Pseudalkalibacillus sp. NRS-1564 TaxID=3233900 RepID=UPI003D293EE2